MFLIVILHLLGHGGVLGSTSGFTYYVAYFIEVFAMCAVDVYALISGYVSYSEQPKKFKFSKFLTIWTQVLFYSFGIALCFFFMKLGSISVKDLIRAMFPIASCQYWYFSSYAALFFLMPLSNQIIRCLSKKQMTGSVMLLGALFSVYTVFCNSIGDFDPFSLNFGTSTLWLLLLYFTGAWIKRIDLGQRVSLKNWWLILIICVAVSWAVKCFLHRSALISYTSPTIIVVAISYIAIFERLKPCKLARNLICFFAPASFGVYLIHDNYLIRKYFISRFQNMLHLNSAVTVVVGILGAAFSILLLCMTIEKIRQWLFKLAGIDKLIVCVGKILDIGLGKCEKKTENCRLLN